MDYILDRSTFRGLEVLDEDGWVVATEGEGMRVGGGETNAVEVGGSTAAERWAMELTGADIPDRCSDLFWIFSPH